MQHTTSCDPQRIQIIHQVDIPQHSTIVYWMSRDMRVQDNWALLHAADIASRSGSPVVVVYSLVPGYLHGIRRHMDWKIASLQEIQGQLEALHIPLIVLGSDTARAVPGQFVDFCQQYDVGAVVTDFCPLRISREWVTYLRNHWDRYCAVVDAHNIVPCWIASQKSEVGARTMRPKLWKLLPEFVTDFPVLGRQMHYTGKRLPSCDWGTLRALSAELPEYAGYHSALIPGSRAGADVLAQFIAERMDRYQADRNNALVDGQSGLSPYLHYGNIAPQRVLLEVMHSTGQQLGQLLDRQKNASGDVMASGSQAFVEESVVRRELSDNFCYYNPHYDSVDCFPDWARESLNQYVSGDRQYIYTYAQFRDAATHDALWNAGQMELLRTGKMHGYMRMYWAKKILEWTESPEQAMHIAVMLNDTYSLDGRDPNGYAGIAWSIGGIHDRPWFPRPVFGVVRYMAESGCKKQFDTKQYIGKWIRVGS